MKLSIITINYNNKDGLQKTIDSVISQIYKDFEWIIIDGGSTDGSKELIEQYADYITYWVSEPDKGIYNAMNKGIKIAEGEYLLFLNSGDWLVSAHTLNRVFDRFCRADIIYGNLLYDKKKVERASGFHNDYIACIDLIKGTLFHPSTFIKRELFEKYGYYDETLKIVADWKFFLYVIAIKGCSVKYINEDISCFDVNGISSTQIVLRKKEREKVLLELFPESVVRDYLFVLHQSEIRKYYISRIIYSFLYRAVICYERIKFRNF